MRESRKYAICLLVLCCLFLLPAVKCVQAQSCSSDDIAKLRGAGMSEQRISEICGGATPKTTPSEALQTLIKLAGQGKAEAAFELGEMYEKGEGVIRDYVQAYVWYSRAHASSGSAQHKSALDGLESKMQSADIEQAQKLAGGQAQSPQTTQTPPKVEPPKPQKVTRWKPCKTTLSFEGSTFSMTRGSGYFPSEYQACNAAKRESKDVYDGATRECQSKLDGSEYRNVRGREVPGQCICEDSRDIGLGFSCDYEFTVECEAEERIVETLQQ